MNYETSYGKTKKLPKKLLDSMSLKKLKKLAQKYKISCYKKGTKVCVKKSTLLKRLKKNRSINKILKTASNMKSHKAKKTSFGKLLPKLSTPLELKTGQTYKYQKEHYEKIPKGFLSHNFQGPGTYKSPGVPVFPYNFDYKISSLKPGAPPYKNINKFGKYFH